ncbi:MAG: molybdopterin-dependent oxidoreductase [Bdellovibrionota bacterium]
MAIHEKHPLWLRCAHWLNVPILSLMVWSGLLIYWANAVYPGFFPQSFFTTLHLDGRLAEGMSIHFALAWIFTLNGALYLAGFFLTGHWRGVLPGRKTWGEVWPTILHDLGRRSSAPVGGKFNAAQRVAYSGAILLGILAVLSGLAIYKPVQLGFALRNLFLGYEGARLVHFLAMLGLTAFAFLHVLQVIRAGWGNFQAMVTGFELSSGAHLPSRLMRRTVFSFIALAAFVGFFTFTWSLASRAPDDDIAPAFRAVHEWNGELWGRLFRPSRSAACTTPALGEIRTNGDLGMEDPVDLAHWKLEVALEGGTPKPLKIEQIKALPRTAAQIEFRCIEGWSMPISYAGARFSDFMKSLGISETYRYVGLATPDGGYYVSVDMASMLHPETVLAYEMNGKPLSPSHGAPLRLVIPVKYGIKSLKRIGKIFFSNTRPPDYWAEQGYDWHSGL